MKLSPTPVTRKQSKSYCPRLLFLPQKMVALPRGSARKSKTIHFRVTRLLLKSFTLVAQVQTPVI